MLQRIGAIWERLRSPYAASAQELAGLEDIELLLRSCEISVALDTYLALPKAALRLVGAPVITYSGHIVHESDELSAQTSM